MTGVQAVRRLPARLPRGAAEAGAVVLLALLYLAFQDKWVLAHDEEHGTFRFLTDVRDWVDDNRNSSPIFLYLVNYIRLGIGDLFDTLQSILVFVSWPGLTALAGAAGLVFAGWRTGLLAVAGVLSFGVLGLWDESVDTLALTLTAVLLSLAIGVPLGVLAGRSDRVRNLFAPVLDVMQIMPAFAYLAPLTLFFLIGPAAATVVTMIYAVPATIRITTLAIRNVPGETVEASVALGSTRWQTLRKVQLPMARPTLALAVNQTIMMALSMVVITALIDGPGLGENIIQGLERINVGMALDAGLAVVVMAIVLDRLTMGASRRAEAIQHAGQGGAPDPRVRRLLLAAGAAIAVIGVVLGRVLAAEFPAGLEFRLAPYANDAVEWMEKNLYSMTDAIKNAATEVLLNPLQELLTTSPWWLIVAAVMALAWRISGTVPALVAGGCLVAIAGLGQWEHSMQTLASVLFAVALTLVIGVVLGVAAARSRTYAAVQRPVLDAAQTMPSFVYLLPALALFGAGRFTAIVAAVIYAVPPVIRLVEDGVRGVSPTVVEAATAAGSTPRQVLWKVQLPMARRALLLAANQGIVMVLAMVVVGGLVGAGALGYDVVSGFSQQEDFGMGLAAGFATVLLGVMLDRITQGAGGRSEEFRAAHKA
ncbi:ABC transporter permease [Spirillospora sp. NPDC048911]|uniref:ABC transporter permease n=1 Tax=Spirillospora sp. NPDC048911 TaxID=3364527 RepID=UPI003714FD19